MLERYLKSSKTLLELAQDRGFPIGSTYVNPTLFKQKYEYFKNDEYEDALDNVIRHHRTNKRLLLCFLRDYSFDNNPNKKNTTQKVIDLLSSRIHSIAEKHRVTKRDQVVIVYNDYEIVTQEFLHLQRNNLRFIPLSRLQFNISRNIFVPTHQRISIYEEQQVIKNYRLLSKEQLPYLPFNDPQALYHGFKSGEIVKIIRKNMNVGYSIVYRFVYSNEIEPYHYLESTYAKEQKIEPYRRRELPKKEELKDESLPLTEEQKEMDKIADKLFPISPSNISITSENDKPEESKKKEEKQEEEKQEEEKQEEETKSTYKQGGAEIELYKEYYTDDEAKKIFEELSKLPYDDSYIKLFGKTRMPRQMLWFSDNLDWTYVFSSSHIGGLKANEFTDLLNEIREKVQATTGKTFNSLLINYYKDGNDGVSWHNDNDPWLGKNFIVPSLSFGAERVFKLRENKKGAKSKNFNLTNGSMILMKGTTQESHVHSIPKTKKTIGPRINLTFRNVDPKLVHLQPKPAKEEKQVGEEDKPNTKKEKLKCEGLRKTKDPKCEDQENCKWTKGKGCSDKDKSTDK